MTSIDFCTLLKSFFSLYWLKKTVIFKIYIIIYLHLKVTHIHSTSSFSSTNNCNLYKHFWPEFLIFECTYICFLITSHSKSLNFTYVVRSQTGYNKYIIKFLPALNIVTPQYLRGWGGGCRIPVDTKTQSGLWIFTIYKSPPSTLTM